MIERRTDKLLCKARLAGRISACLAAEGQVLAQDATTYMPSRLPSEKTLARLVGSIHDREWKVSDPDVNDAENFILSERAKRYMRGTRPKDRD